MLINFINFLNHSCSIFSEHVKQDAWREVQRALSDVAGPKEGSDRVGEGFAGVGGDGKFLPRRPIRHALQSGGKGLEVTQVPQVEGLAVLQDRVPHAPPPQTAHLVAQSPP